MTVREWFRELVAAKERHTREHDRDLFVAWNTAQFVRGAKMPDRLKHRGRPRQTVKEQIAMWQVAAARFGGTFRPVAQQGVTAHG